MTVGVSKECRCVSGEGVFKKAFFLGDVAVELVKCHNIICLDFTAVAEEI